MAQAPMPAVEPVRERVHSDGSRFSASPTVHAAYEAWLAERAEDDAR